MGSLIYFAVEVRHDISVAASILGAYVKSSTKLVKDGAKHVLRYLKRTLKMSLILHPSDGTQIGSFVDSSCGSITVRKRRSRWGALLNLRT